MEEEHPKKKKKKKESGTEIHQSVNISIDDSVISRSNIGNIGGGGGDAQVRQQVLNKRTAGVKKKFCPNCGSKLPTSYKANFCPECGAAVE